MDKEQINKFKMSIDNMRAKVIQAKGESVEGLSKLPVMDKSKIVKKSKELENN